MTFYVTAIEQPRTYFLAGPYATREEAEAKVKEARTIACDFERNREAGRAHFMAYGVSRWKSEDPAPRSSLGIL
jgi:hypothetical protein